MTESYITTLDSSLESNAIINAAYEKWLDDDRWDYDFSEELTADPSDIHCEASYLSRKIFAELFKTMAPFCNNKNIEIDMKSIIAANDDNGNGRSILLGDKSRISFDVMNNPDNNDGNSYYIGSIVKKVSERKELIAPLTLDFSNRYHTIGNFAPTPWWVDNSYSNGLQGVHNSTCAEWWDVFLLYLQKHMHKEIMSFRDYLILTCQFFYIYMPDDALMNDLHDVSSSKSVSELCSSVSNWHDQIKTWSSMIPKNDEDIGLIPLMSIGQAELSPLSAWKTEWESDSWWEEQRHHNKVVDEQTIKDADILICRLIEARGRCIMGLLWEDWERQRSDGDGA